MRWKITFGRGAGSIGRRVSAESLPRQRRSIRALRAARGTEDSREERSPDTTRALSQDSGLSTRVTVERWRATYTEPNSGRSRPVIAAELPGATTNGRRATWRADSEDRRAVSRPVQPELRELAERTELAEDGLFVHRWFSASRVENGTGATWLTIPQERCQAGNARTSAGRHRKSYNKWQLTLSQADRSRSRRVWSRPPSVAFVQRQGAVVVRQSPFRLVTQRTSQLCLGTSRDPGRRISDPHTLLPAPSEPTSRGLGRARSSGDNRL